MKVAITSRCVFKLHGYGGMERYVYYFSKHLAENDISVELFTSVTKKQTSCDLEKVKPTFLKPNVNESIRLLRGINYRLFLMKVSTCLKKSKYDIVHAFGICPVEYLKYKSRGKVVIQPFGNEEFKSREKENFFKRIYLDLFMRNPKLYSVRNADAIASEGEIQTKEIMQLFGVPKEKIFYLPDGVDLDEIEEYTKDVEVTKEDYNLQDADIVLMNVNRLVPNKGVPYLIEAMKILNQELNVKLILVGTGSEEERIKRLIKQLDLEDKVKHLKNIPDKLMFQLYTLADISVTPTLYEGLPLVVLEAMACGKPIVASNVSEVPQAVKDGVNGFLVPPKNPKAIADAVLKIYDKNLFMKMGKTSKEIVKKYDWSRITKMAIRKYEELIGK